MDIFSNKNFYSLIVFCAAFLMLPLFFSVARAATTISECGYLDQEGETYILQNDVRSDGTCFAIINNNITLDLNGHSITYNNDTPVIVPNGSFELGSGASANSWNQSEAPNFSRSVGSYVKPVSVYEGSYAAKINLPSPDQKIRSMEKVTLEPNTTYSISAMFFNNYQNGGYQSDALTLFAGLEDGTDEKTASRAGITWRGFQYTFKTFTTGENPESYNIVAGISGASSAAAGSVYIDDIKIQKHRSMGIAVCPVNWYGSGSENTPGLNRYCPTNNLKNIVIKNGSIVQGSGNGSHSHAIYVSGNNSPNCEYYGLNISISGDNSKALEAFYFSESSFHDNTITSNVNTITSRDNYDGAVIKINYPSYESSIYKNTIAGGVQTGICATSQSGKIPLEIYQNSITLQTKYTNDFAITSNGSEIYDNVIDCGSGKNSCRGIAIGGDGTEVWNNNVAVQQLPRNQEYNGCEMSGAYGMQMEYSAKNVHVYQNTVTANADECEAYALRANPDTANSANNNLHDNIFASIASGNARAASIKYAQINSAAIALRNNIFRTNHRWIYVDGGGPVVNPFFSGNRWETVPPIPSPFYPFEVYTWAGSYFQGTFLDNTYGNSEDKNRFESEVFRTANGTPDLNSNFSVSSENVSKPNSPQGLSVR